MDANWTPPATHTVCCSVCGDPVPFADVVLQKQQARKVCRSVDCRRLLEQEAHLPPALFRSQLEFQRQRIQDLRAREAARQAHRERIEREEEAENQAIAAALLAGEPDADRIALVSLPRGLDRLEPLTDERRERYRTHLLTCLADALACNDIDELPRDQHYDAHDRCLQTEQFLAQRPRLAQLSDQLCGHCRGGCCAAGSDQAYLTAISLRRVLDANPGMTGDALVQGYLDCLPAQSVAGSCINQTATGCALSRELRSDVCNGYFCPEVKLLQEQWETRNPPKLLVIQRAHHNWNRFEADDPNPVVTVAWVDDDGVTAAETMPVPPDAAAAES